MRTAVIAFVLCLGAAASGAQCLDNTPRASAASAKSSTAGHPPAEIIKTAGAVTHDGEASARPAPGRAQAGPEDRPQRTGITMLLAALAVMSGIALRRYAAKDE